jgi:hypothetical protein
MAMGLLLMAAGCATSRSTRADADLDSDPMRELAKVRLAYRQYLIGDGLSGRRNSTAPYEDKVNAIETFDSKVHGSLMFALAKRWYADRDAKARDLFTKAFAMAYNQGYRPGGKRVTWYPNRDFVKALGLMVEDLDTPYRQMCAEYLYWNANMENNLAWDDDHKGGLNTDYIYCDFYGAFGGVLYNGSDEEAVSNCLRLKRWLDIAFKASPGCDDFIKVDGVSFHHWTHYNNYMYAFGPCIDHLALLRDTRFQINPSSYLFFRDAVRTMTIMSNGGFLAPSLAGRNPGPGNRLNMDRVRLKKLASIGGDILGTGSADPVVAGILNRLHPGDSSLPDYAAEPVPNGFWQFNYSPVALYRQSDWVATMHGMNNTFWGAEIYRGANRYGRYQSYGALEIMYPGGPAGSGYSLAGYDWNKPNGTTTIHLPFEKLVATKNRIDERSQLDFAGGLSFQLREDGLNGVEGECGLYGVDFQEMANPGWGNPVGVDTHNPTFVFKKSMFCFEDLIICLGSGIANDDTVHRTITTLYQGHLPDKNTPIVLDGRIIVDFPYSQSLPGTNSHHLMDAYGTGYVVAPGVKVDVSRRNQTSPKATGKGTATGDFASAVLDHGTGPDGAEYEYVVCPGTTATALQDLAKRIQAHQVYAVLEKGSRAHVLEHLPSGTVGYVVFGPAEGLPGYVKATDAKCLAMAAHQSTGLRVCIVNPLLGIGSRSNKPSVPKTLTLTVRGHWTASSNPAVVIARATPSETVLEVETVHGLPFETVLSAPE